MSTLKTTNLQNASAASPAIVLAADGSATAQLSSINGGPLAGSRNRIINGDMRIDQRNAGASVTPGSATYVIDRWKNILNLTSKYSVQRNAGSVTPPAGFTNYLGITSLSAYSVTGNETYSIEQVIEGFNVADLNWGTANALPCTLSFWVRSSLTGTFGGSIATTKTAIWVMPFTYTISSANTWTYVTVSITAPTSTGGANTDNTDGVFVRFGLGSSGTLSGGTAGVWTNANNFVQPSGTVSVVGTNGATFYITGVQLEPGTVATPFERIDYSESLRRCQRYYFKTYNQSVVPGASGSSATYRTRAYAGSYASATVQFPVLTRTVPTCTVYNPHTGATNSWRDVDSSADRTAGISTALDSAVVTESSSVTTNTSNLFHIVATAEL